MRVLVTQLPKKKTFTKFFLKNKRGLLGIYRPARDASFRDTDHSRHFLQMKLEPIRQTIHKAMCEVVCSEVQPHETAPSSENARNGVVNPRKKLHSWLVPGSNAHAACSMLHPNSVKLGCITKTTAQNMPSPNHFKTLVSILDGRIESVPSMYSI